MLRSIYINNIALIKSQTINFADGFNVLSGETGAGKSIIVDSLMLILGGKFDKVMLRYGENSCRVEAEFDTTSKVRSYLESIDIDADDITVISRKMYAEGKNENRINGRAVTLSVIRELGSFLLDICGQNEYQFLSSVSNHIKVLDSYNKENADAYFPEYLQTVKKIREINKKLAEIKDSEDRAESIEFLKRKLYEIDKAKVENGELDRLEKKRNVLKSSEKIVSAINTAVTELSEDKNSALSFMENASKAMSVLESFGNDYATLAERLKSATIEIEDISDTLAQMCENFDLGSEDLDAIEDRIHKVRELIRKYGSYEAIQDKRREFKEKIEFLENADKLYSDLTTSQKMLTNKAFALAQKISDSRKNAAVNFEKAVMKELSDLGMENSVFKVMFSDFPHKNECAGKFTSTGLDSIEFYLSPNVGQPLKPLTKIISGGEQSRLMLALKVISGNADEIPSLVFDEIDTGISGKIGLEVAKKLAILSSLHQVLCVTHLPQIAAMADKNFFISKKTTDGTTVTDVCELQGKEAIGEIARLSGGKGITSQAENNAEEMKLWSEQFKRETFVKIKKQ